MVANCFLVALYIVKNVLRNLQAKLSAACLLILYTAVSNSNNTAADDIEHMQQDETDDMDELHNMAINDLKLYKFVT